MSAPGGPSLTPEQVAALRAESKQPTAAAIVITFTVLSFSVVLLRYGTRFVWLRNPGLEDYFIGIAMLASIAMAVCMGKQIEAGSGLHVMFLTLPQIQDNLRFLFGSIMSYNISLTLTKLSILLQYRRLFISKRALSIVIYISMGIITAYGIEVFFTGMFSCVPIRAFWDLMLQPTAKCLPKFPLWYTNAALNIATDLLLAAIPLPVIHSLQMDRKHKIALMIVFAMGWVVCIVSMLRLRALSVFDKHFDDATWYSPEAAYWSCIETNVAITCASLPALKPLLARLVPRFATTRQYAEASDEPSGHVRKLPFINNIVSPSSSKFSGGSKSTTVSEKSNRKAKKNHLLTLRSVLNGGKLWKSESDSQALTNIDTELDRWPPSRDRAHFPTAFTNERRSDASPV